MPDGQVIEFTRVTKRFNDVTAVSDFSARIEPGVVTAFLGPNGAGKTTTLRILLGQVRPTSGSATIGGVAFADLRTPLRTIGSVLEETVYRPRRTANRQLTIAAKANGIPLSRVNEVLALVGLDGEGEGRIGSFSLGMRQRLSVAHALLGDAGTLVFDEPANGLDPEGIRWMRLLMRRLADEGRTVIVSSHVLSEVEQVADHVLVLSKGSLVLSSAIEDLADPTAGSVVVDAADRVALTSALTAAGFEIEILRSGLTVRGGDTTTVGAVAAAAGVALSTLVQRGPTLEDVFIELVRNGRFEPRAAIAAAPAADAATVADAASAGAVAAADVAGAAAVVPAAAVAGGIAGAGADAEGVVAEADASEVASDVVAPEEWTAAVQADAGEPAAAIDEAVDGEASEADGDLDAVIDPEPLAPAGPSFDDILFGAGSVTTDEDSVFDASSDSAAPDEHASEAVDIFARLGGNDVVESHETSASDAADEAPGESDDAASSDGDVDVDEQRSAAVSSMLAAAARAYYDDEPKPYPSADAEPAGEQESDGHDGDAEEHSDETSSDEHQHDEHQHHEHQHHEHQHHEHQHDHDEHREGEHHHG